MRGACDSRRLRRFWLIASEGELPEESSVRELSRRWGAESVSELPGW
jgi:hypothetical protein